MQTIYFDPRWLDAVRSGRKTRTTRFREAARVGVALLEFELKGSCTAYGESHQHPRNDLR